MIDQITFRSFVFSEVSLCKELSKSLAGCCKSVDRMVRMPATTQKNPLKLACKSPLKNSAPCFFAKSFFLKKFYLTGFYEQ